MIAVTDLQHSGDLVIAENYFEHSDERLYLSHKCQITFKVVWDSCQKITLLLLKRKSVRVIVPESCF